MKWSSKLRENDTTWYEKQYQVPSNVEIVLKNVHEGKVSPLKTIPKPESPQAWKTMLTQMPSSRHVSPERLEDWSNTLAGTGFKQKQRTHKPIQKASYSNAGRRVGGNKRVDMNSLSRSQTQPQDSAPTPRTVSYKHALMHRYTKCIPYFAFAFYSNMYLWFWQQCVGK
jgi:hypothetical protein